SPATWITPRPPPPPPAGSGTRGSCSATGSSPCTASRGLRRSRQGLPSMTWRPFSGIPSLAPGLSGWISKPPTTREPAARSDGRYVPSTATLPLASPDNAELTAHEVTFPLYLVRGCLHKAVSRLDATQGRERFRHAVTTGPDYPVPYGAKSLTK